MPHKAGSHDRASGANHGAGGAPGRARAPRPRPADAHKGTFGTVIVIGGCETMPGAPALCARAALRGGAGLVKIAAPRGALATAITIEPGATGIIIGDDTATAMHQLDEADGEHRAVLAVGPGLGGGREASELVDAVLRGRRAIVLDADGLNALARTCKPRPRPIGADAPPLVLTPHPGEFRRLAEPMGIDEDPTSEHDRPAAAAKLAEAHQAVVVLKGRHTVVSDGRRVYVNRTGNVALATAGSGDVLTGLIASLMAQGMPPFDAASLGAHLHGLAADLWAAEHGPSGLTASDLADRLPDAFQRHRRGAAKA